MKQAREVNRLILPAFLVDLKLLANRSNDAYVDWNYLQKYWLALALMLSHLNANCSNFAAVFAARRYLDIPCHCHCRCVLKHLLCLQLDSMVNQCCHFCQQFGWNPLRELDQGSLEVDLLFP